MSVPSLSTLEGVKKYINAVGNTPSAIAPKQTVMLDWASKEDGSHILTITVGNKVSKKTAYFRSKCKQFQNSRLPVHDSNSDFESNEFWVDQLFSSFLRKKKLFKILFYFSGSFLNCCFYRYH